MARSTSLRVSRRWERSATSCSRARSSENRETAISMAGTTSLLLNGFTRYAMAPASLARSTSSRWEKAVSMRTGAMDSPHDLLGGRDAVQDGHLHVQDDEIGAVLAGELDGRGTVTGLADDRVALFLQHLFEVEADEGLVLGDDDAGRQRRDVRRVGVVGGLGRLGGGHGGSSLRGSALHQEAYLAAGRTSDRVHSVWRSAGLVEWHTRMSQTHLPVRACGFESRTRHSF